jgi:periodic tryptophan protein 2
MLRRYRNFRTFTTPEAVQLACVAIEGSGEVICAGSSDTFQVFLWNMRTGQLLDALSGHEGPVSALAFNPSTPSKNCREWILLVGHRWTVLAQT